MGLQTRTGYSIGILDFVFEDHQHQDTIVHSVELKDQHCDIFYDKLKFIYIELPKFKKTIDQITSHQDKWLYLLKHLPELKGYPNPFQDSVFLQLFEIAEIANFTATEQDAYQESLKHYRDLNNVVDTDWKEGQETGEKTATIRIARSLIGELSTEAISRTTGLSIDQIQALKTEADKDNID